VGKTPKRKRHRGLLREAPGPSKKDRGDAKERSAPRCGQLRKRSHGELLMEPVGGSGTGLCGGRGAAKARAGEVPSWTE